MTSKTHGPSMVPAANIVAVRLACSYDSSYGISYDSTYKHKSHRANTVWALQMRIPRHAEEGETNLGDQDST